MSGAIRLAASDNTMAPHNDETVAALRLKHPQRAASPDNLPPTPFSASSCLVLHESAILKSIKSFPAGSADGINGLKPQHVKDLISAHSGEGQRLLALITEFAIVCLVGGSSTLDSSHILWCKKRWWYPAHCGRMHPAPPCGQGCLSSSTKSRSSTAGTDLAWLRHEERHRGCCPCHSSFSAKTSTGSSFAETRFQQCIQHVAT